MPEGSEKATLVLIEHDPHNDSIEVNVEPDPQPWGDPDEPVCEPVVYITGDAYLSPEQARRMADALTMAAADVERLRCRALLTSERPTAGASDV